MRAIVYRVTGGPDVLRKAEWPVPEPGPGEVRVHLAVAGVNPTDWKMRRGSGPGQPPPFPEVVPGQDGAGTVDALGPDTDVPGLVPGARVWVWEAGWQRAAGTAQDYVVLPAAQVVPLPDNASLELGASLGIPALTAHRALTLGADGPERLGPGTLDGRTVLVAGGAGAVGNAAVQLARWSGARVLATVSSAAKGELARAAGADAVVDYRARGAATVVRDLAPEGVDLVVELAPATNAALDAAVLAPGATVSVYADNGGAEALLPVRAFMTVNASWRFVFVYTVPAPAKSAAVADVARAVADGALRVGTEAGLSLHRFPLEQAAAAHAAVEAGTVGKVLLELR